MTVLNQIPNVGRILCPITFLAYLGIGALAGSFLTPSRDANGGARAGSLAGLISGVIGGLTWIVILVIYTAALDMESITSLIPSENMRQWAELGIDRDILAALPNQGWAALSGGLFFVIELVAGVGFGAIGGAIFSAARPE